MAQQIKKKFLSPEVISYFDNQIDSVESSVLTLSSSLSNVQTSISAIQAKLDATVYYHELHVNFDYTGTSDGSEYAPFKTIQSAVDAAAAPGRSGANTVIYLHPKRNTSISENVTINAAVNNLFIKALASGVDAAQIVINGQFKITGTSVRVRLEGFQISSPSGTPCLVIDGSNGAHSFINMDFAGGGGVQFTNTWKSWHQFVDCGITGNLSLGGTPAAQSVITVYRLRGFCTPVVSHANATLSIVEAYSLAGLTHSAGNVSIFRSSSPTANFNSTAAYPSMFAMFDSTMQKTDLSFAKINKTGTGLFILSNISRDESTDVLSGTRVNLGATVADAKYVPAVAGSWSASVISAKTALDEVMAKAKTVESGLASEITTARNAESALSSRISTIETNGTTKSYVDTQDAAKLVEAKAYTDTKIAAIPAVDLSNYFTKSEVNSKETALDGKITTEKNRIDAILSASQADKDTFAEIVTLINSIDTANDQAFAGYVLSNDAALAQEVSNRQSADASTLQDSKDYTDAQIAAIPDVDLSNYYNKTEVDSAIGSVEDSIAQEIIDRGAADSALDLRLDTIEPKVTTLEGEMDSVQSDISSHDSRISALEALTDGPSFSNGSVVVASELGFIDLDKQYIKLMSVAVGRMAVHEGEDFTVSVVGGKTRLTWINSLANPSGEEKIETGDKVFFVGAF